MQAAAALRILQAWEPFAGLPLRWQQRLAGDLQALQLRPGQKLYDYNSLPPGVALINRGQLRLLSLDDQNEPFTLQRLAPGDMVGHVGLLRGVTGQAVAASDHCQVWLLPQASFLSAVTEEPTLMPWFVAMGMEELYAVAAASPLPWAPGRVALRAWASNHLIESASVGEVVLLPPGDHSFGADWGPWLLSSGNVSGFSPGDELLGPLRLNVKGLLPARLLAKAVATPPQDVPAALVVSPELGARPAPLAEAELLEPN